MLVDIDIDKFSKGYRLKFPVEVFKSEDDFKMGITIITVFSLDFDLDPDLEVEDMKEILEKCQELQKPMFTVEIGDEGIEVDI